MEEYALELHELIQGYSSLNRVRRTVGFFGIPDWWIPSVEHVAAAASPL